MLDWLTRRARAALRKAARPLAYVPLDGPRGRYPVLGDRAPSVDVAGMDWAVVEDRSLHRHGWFSDLARHYAATRDDKLAALACAELARWLAADRPGEGPGWVHPSDSSFRLVHWAIGVGALGDALEPDLRRMIAGAARVHALAALAELGHQADDHRRVAHAAALSLAGFGWPGLPEASRFRSEGLSWLGRSLPAQILADGSPRWGSTANLRVVVELGVLCRQVAQAERGAWPGGLAPALDQAAFFLGALGDTLPPFGEAPIAPLGMSIGEAPPVPEKDWSMLTFRDGGWVIARARYKGGLNRLVVRAGESVGPHARDDLGQIGWELAGTPILVDPGASLPPGERGALPWPSSEPKPPANLMMARQDGREVRVVVQRLGRRSEARRDILLAATRLVVTDRFGACEPTSLVWPLGPGWVSEMDEGGWIADREGVKLRVGFDGGAATAVDGGFRVGVAGGLEQRVKSRFEVR